MNTLNVFSYRINNLKILTRPEICQKFRAFQKLLSSHGQQLTRAIINYNSGIKIVTRVSKVFFFLSPYPVHLADGKFRLTTSLWGFSRSIFAWSNVLVHLILILNLSWKSFRGQVFSEIWEVVVICYLLTVYIFLSCGYLCAIWLKRESVFLFNSVVELEQQVILAGKQFHRF